MKPTIELYQLLQAAYDHFNRDLFAGELPECLVTLQRKRNAKGFFHAEIFRTRDSEDNNTLDEIALNPELFDRTEAEILSTLAHEQVHLWQHYFGKPSRNGYHNREWADKMLAIGLQPVGVPNAEQETGQKCTHTIITDGSYARSCSAFLEANQERIKWFSQQQFKKDTKKNKVTYQCPSCEVKAWGKPDLHIICGDCEEPMELIA